MGSSTPIVKQVTVATATATEILQLCQVGRISKVMIKERDDVSGDGSTVFMLGHTSAGVTTAQPAAGAAADGPITYGGGSTVSIDMLNTPQPLYLYHTAGGDITFSLMIWK